MTSTNGQRITTETTHSQFEQLSPAEMYAQNRCLTEALAVTLEFKRILEYMLEDPEVSSSTAVEKYKHHVWKYLHKFRAYRTGFGDHLVKSIANLDNSQLTKCHNSDCRLADCNKIDYMKMGPTIDLEPRRVKIKMPKMPKKSQKKKARIIIDISGENEVEIIDDSTQKKKVDKKETNKNTTNGAEKAADGNATMINEDQNVSKMDSSKAVTEEEVSGTIREENTNTDDVNTDAPMNADDENLPIDSADNVDAEQVNVSKAEDNFATSFQQMDEGGHSPVEQFRGSLDDQSSVMQDVSQPEAGDFIDEPAREQAPFEDDKNADNVVRVIPCRAEDCHQTFSSIPEATEHYDSHDKIFKCSHCALMYSNKINLYHHFLTHNPTKPTGVCQNDGDDV